MPIPVICTCTAKLRIADMLRGKQIQCPKCGTVHAISAKGTAAVVEGTPGKSAPAAPPKLDALLEEAGISEKEQEKLEDELEKGEVVWWAGKPDGKVAHSVGWLYACGPFFLAVVLGIVVTVMSLGPMNDLMIQIPLGLAAVLALVAGCMLPFWNRKRFSLAMYAITNRRALAWDPSFFLQVRFQAYDSADVARVRRQNVPFGKANNVGNLVFAAEVSRKNQRVVRRHGFFFIRDVAKVEKTLRQQLIDPYMDRLLE